MSNWTDAPPPDLRIIPTGSAQPHEENDSQRAQPLIVRLQSETLMINPPVVAPVDAGRFVILDGANRCYAFSCLGYPHILVQVASYESGYIELDTWRHVVSGWHSDEFVASLSALPQVQLADGQNAQAIAHVLLRDGRVISICSSVQNTRERNASLREVVAVYQRNAALYRTSLGEPGDVWPLFPKAIAVIEFPQYQPHDIIAAAKYKAYLPPGISRHIVHGRALRVNYPLDALRDDHTPLAEKNAALTRWLQEKLARRAVRYYAEAVYQFDE